MNLPERQRDVGRTLAEAYEATLYEVGAPPEFVLRIGLSSPALAQVYAVHGVTCAGYLTAWNPMSQPADAAFNARAQARLRERIHSLGFVSRAGVGRHPDGDWAEESLFVPGLSLEAALALGRDFNQAAIVWCDADAVPRLYWPLASSFPDALLLKETIAALLGSTPDAVAVLDAAGRIIQFNDAFMRYHRFASREDCARNVADYPALFEVLDAQGRILPVQDWLASRCLRDGESGAGLELTVRRRATGEHWTGSYSFAPIRAASGRIGGMVMIARDITGMRQAEQSLTSMRAELETEAQALARLNRVSERLWRTQDLVEGLDEMLDVTLELLTADMGVVQVHDAARGELVLTTQRGYPEEVIERYEQWRRGRQLGLVTEQAFREGRRIVIEDTETLDDAEYVALCRKAGFRAMQCTPLITREGERVGMLVTHWRRPYFLAPRDSDRLDLYARQAAEYIARSRLEASTRTREAWLAAILDTAADAIITLDDTGIVTSANRATLRMFGHAPEQLLGRHVSLLLPMYAPGGEEIYLTYLREAAHEGAARGLGLFAVRSDGSSFPIMLALSQFDQGRTCTAIIRDVTERRQLQQQLLETAAAEQRRIGQELHDGVQQELTGLALLAESLQDLEQADAGGAGAARGAAAPPAALRQVAARLARGLREAQQNVRALAHGILPVEIPGDGLPAALQELADRTAASSVVGCEFLPGDGLLGMSSHAAGHLYRVAQEAVGNALRHSGARKVVIALDDVAGGEGIQLEVRDDGIGIEDGRLEARPGGEGMGLRTMEYRANLLGGLLQIGRGAAGGTVVRCVVPRN